MPTDPSSPTSPLARVRTAFFTGVLLLAPLWVTIWAFTAVIGFVGGTFRPIYAPYLPESLQRIPFFWDLVTTAVVVVLITALGFLSRYVFGKVFLSMTERAIQRIPGLGPVYNSVKQIVATFSTQNRNLFSKVVMIEFPRKGVWVVGFLTNKAQSEAHAVTGAESWTIFVPTTPNPTSGFLVIVPRQDVIELDMTVGDGMKLIISGGTVLPPWPVAKTENTGQMTELRT